MLVSYLQPPIVSRGVTNPAEDTVLLTASDTETMASSYYSNATRIETQFTTLGTSITLGIHPRAPSLTFVKKVLNADWCQIPR